MFEKLPFPKPVVGPPTSASRVESKAPSTAIPAIQVPSVIGAAKASDASVSAAAAGWSEKFTADAPTGAATLSIPLPMTTARALTPELSVVYVSSSRNGVFGHGWTLSGIGKISRRTSLSLPRYLDHGDQCDQFEFNGSDIVPVQDDVKVMEISEHLRYHVRCYRLRLEGDDGFIKIEHWKRVDSGGNDDNDAAPDDFWRTIDKSGTASTYGLCAQSRVQDSSNGTTRIYEWFNEGTIDRKGNAIKWEYKSELTDFMACPDDPHEFHTQRYLKAIKYGNVKPVTLQSFDDWRLEDMGWLFHVIFDYGEHGVSLDGIPAYDEIRPWDTRDDAFSSYRAGFEVRTRRYCQRVLMFHRFPELQHGNEVHTLVKSVSFLYDSKPEGYRITNITGSGFIRGQNGTMIKEDMPSLTFSYSQPANLNHRPVKIHRVPEKSLPASASAILNSGEWTTLDGDGITGILSAKEDGWYFSRNLTPVSQPDVRFTGYNAIGPHPNIQLNEASQLVDPDGKGEIGVQATVGGTTGFFMRHSDQWSPFQPIRSLPSNCNSQTPNVRSLDLTGNGIPDFLVANGDQGFTWYPSKPSWNEGFLQAQSVSASMAPRLLFDDGTESIYLADMTGDGMIDIVRIINGSIFYWPNLGYGRFGRKIVMRNSPVLDSADLFHQKRIILTDVSGTGTTDLLYFPANGSCHVYENLSGNGWSKRKRIQGFPQLDNLAKMNVFDILGTGTSCIVWMSTMPSNSGLCYVDLSPDGKPGLLTSYSNGIGLTMTCTYAPSTKFYLQDERAGCPWLTKLPFPVHCLESTCTIDSIKKTRLVQRYAYHDGFWDKTEREFCGFGMVEKWDSDEIQNLDETTAPLRSLPIHTKSWYHTGSIHGVRKRAFQFFHGTGMEKMSEFFRRDVDFPTCEDQIEAAEYLRQASRAVKGTLAHKEVYADDGTDLARNPYFVSHHTSAIRCIQPPSTSQYGVYASIPAETLQISTERQKSDFRVSHEIVLETDAYLNVLASASIEYGRGTVVPIETGTDTTHLARQKKTNVVYEHNFFTNDVVERMTYLAPLPAGEERWEVVGIPLPSGLLAKTFFRGTEKLGFLDTLDTISRSDMASLMAPGEVSMSKILLESSRALFRSNDLTCVLPHQKVESLAIPGRSYDLVLTPNMLSSCIGDWVDIGALTSKSASGGGYSNLYGDGNLWAPGGEQSFAPAMNQSFSSPSEELEAAKSSFFTPTLFRHPFDSIATVSYDQYHLLPVSTTDAVGNCTSSEYDYRTMKPRMITDCNGNRKAFAYDAFGECTAICDMGKQGNEYGDVVDTADIAILSEPQTTRLVKFLESPTMTFAEELLGKATIRSLIVRGYSGPDGTQLVGINIRREQYRKSSLQLAILYCDGSGNVLQTKLYAGLDPDIKETQWLTSEWKVLNNKDLPVQIYEPFYDQTHRFRRFAMEGVKSTIFYDPIGREIGRLYPDRTFTKTVVTPWMQVMYDRGDTVLEDLAKDGVLGGYAQLLDEKDFCPSWMAATRSDSMKLVEEASAKYSETPSTTHLDSGGHLIASTVHNGAAGMYTSLCFPDTQGRVEKVVDTLARTAAVNRYDLRGQLIHCWSLDGGDRWTVYDVTQKPILARDSKGITTSIKYDALRRQTDVVITEQDGSRFTATRNVYGEDVTDEDCVNLRGHVYKVFDQAGEVTNKAYDIRGNLVNTVRRFAVDYRRNLNCGNNIKLHEERFETRHTYDALNRIIETKDSSGLTTRYKYDPLGRASGVTVIKGDIEAHMVEDIFYNARNQKTKIRYGNSVTTSYDYDHQNFRLTRQKTVLSSRVLKTLQDMNYTYDCLGNVVTVEDLAKDPLFSSGEILKREMCYAYDALERLVRASGREHLGQKGSGGVPYTASRIQGAMAMGPNDSTRLGRYVETYRYDSEGNILEMKHQVPNHSERNWTRDYNYEEPMTSNRVTSTCLGDREERYTYDANGSITSMSGFSSMVWDYADLLSSSSRQRIAEGAGVPEITYYRYDSTGHRVRKITEHSRTGPDDPHRKMKETLYLPGYDLFRTYTGDGISIKLETTTAKIHNEDENIGFLDFTSIRDSRALELPTPLFRYVINDFLSSVGLELDDIGDVVSHEEYSPYGSSTVLATTPEKTAGKRYRYMAKERDRETGLYYCEARYLVPWLGRWLSVDPSGFPDGMNGYCYVACRPSVLNDPSGLEGEGGDQKPLQSNNKPPLRLPSINNPNGVPRAAGGPVAGPPRSHSQFRKLPSIHRQATTNYKSRTPSLDPSWPQKLRAANELKAQQKAELTSAAIPGFMLNQLAAVGYKLPTGNTSLLSKAPHQLEGTKIKLQYDTGAMKNALKGLDKGAKKTGKEVADAKKAKEAKIKQEKLDIENQKKYIDNLIWHGKQEQRLDRKYELAAMRDGIEITKPLEKLFLDVRLGIKNWGLKSKK
ncbi:SpvB-domain-containing protein [Ascodesmis nigricans]|uniref:SpvB-domain-containing protein n=1 Tax=Ascodesmis nigricans TaxID=341454 RepID=A0A4S2MPI6_9PEZI|nr:SpvB-domain-containing protein [Ascodesmis nigricans]